MNTEQYIKALNAHDWSFEWSDDDTVWKRGRQQRADLTPRANYWMRITQSGTLIASTTTLWWRHEKICTNNGPGVSWPRQLRLRHQQNTPQTYAPHGQTSWVRGHCCRRPGPHAVVFRHTCKVIHV